jgi:hypothetical protein
MMFRVITLYNNKSRLVVIESGFIIVLMFKKYSFILYFITSCLCGMGTAAVHGYCRNYLKGSF